MSIITKVRTIRLKEQLTDLRSKTRTPVCGSETLASAVTFRQMFVAGTFDYAMIDLVWRGGLTEGRKIAALHHQAYFRRLSGPILPHGTKILSSLCLKSKTAWPSCRQHLVLEPASNRK